MDIRKCNVEREDLPIQKNSFDIVWSSNLLEHVINPHLVLLKLRDALKADGLLIVTVPVILKNRVLCKIGRLAAISFDGYKAADHVNAFTLDTISFMVERAGFGVIECCKLAFSNPFLFACTNPLFKKLAPTTAVVAAKDISWSYPDKALKIIKEGRVEYRT